MTAPFERPAYLSRLRLSLGVLGIVVAAAFFVWLLTMWEFSRLYKRQQQKVENDKRFTAPDSRVYRENVRNVSHL